MKSPGSPNTGTAPLARFAALLMTLNRLFKIVNQFHVRLNFSVTRYLDTIKFSSRLFCYLEKQKVWKFRIDLVVGFCAWFVQSILVDTFWHEIRLNEIPVSVQLHVDSGIFSVFCQSVWHWLLIPCRKKLLQSTCVLFHCEHSCIQCKEVLAWDQKQNSGIQEEQSLVCPFHLTMF